MTRIGLVGAGAMGSALGANWLAGGAEVSTCVVGRSERTQRLAAEAGLVAAPGLDELMSADLLVSVVPPGEALRVARAIADAALRTGARPLVVDLNAVSPTTMRKIDEALRDAGLDLVDGSISGGPPTPGRATRVYLCGPRAVDVGQVAHPWLDIVTLAGGLGSASALKMCTASMYKGSQVLIAQAMLTAQRHGVLAEFLADTARAWPDDVPSWHHDVALAATKAHRFVAEMREIAETQRDAGSAGELFEGIAEAYERIAHTPLGRRAPESLDRAMTHADVLAGLTNDASEQAVVFDFSGTLFHIDSAERALLAALGPGFVHLAPQLVRFGGINGSATPRELPAELSDVWDRRDLSSDDHRRAYAGLSQHAGLTAAQAEVLYDYGISPQAWHPFPETIGLLRDLRGRGIPVAVLSNIGWDPRPVLERYGLDRDVDVLVLSYERGVQKPDPDIFRLACAELGVSPQAAVMVGDNPDADGAATAVGMRFSLVAADPAAREPDELRRATGLYPAFSDTLRTGSPPR